MRGRGREDREAEEHGKKEARFELRQRREVTLTSISVRLRGARRCLQYIRKRLASVRQNKSNTGSSKRLSLRFVSYLAAPAEMHQSGRRRQRTMHGRYPVAAPPIE